MSDGGSYYIIIPGPVKASKILSPQAKLLFGEIAIKCNLYGYCWATNNYFSEVFDCNVRSIQRYIKELEDANFVAIELIEDVENGTKRKITATVLSQHPATVLSPIPTTEPSPPPMTELSSPPMTAVSDPHDNGVATPGDKSVIHTNNTSEINNIISKKGNNKTIAPPVNGNAAKNKTGELFTAEAQPPQDPAPTPPKKTKSLYQRFIDVYDKWHRDRSEGIPPVMNGAGGTAAKSIIAHLTKIAKARAEKDGAILDEAGAEENILQSWSYILNNWEKLDLFLQEKTRLIDINSNLQNIIAKIKQNGNGQNQKGINGNATGKFSDNRSAAERFNSINEKYSSWETDGV